MHTNEEIRFVEIREIRGHMIFSFRTSNFRMTCDEMRILTSARRT
jgi:hypothetical protein